MLTAEKIADWVKEEKQPNLQAGLAAVNEYINGLPIVVNAGGHWSATVELAAKMLLARWLRRRNSPNGIEAATDMNVTYIARYDSDISRMLQLDRFRKPQVG